ERRDRVGERDKRRVQQPGDPADHAQPDERRQHEDEHHRPVVVHGFRTSPAWVTHVSRVISSSKSRTRVPSRVTCNRKLETFLAYIWLACTGTVLGRWTGPRISTPCRRTSAPASASS